MSSILRALKRLEERPADASGGPPWEEKFSSEHTHTRAPQALWRTKPMIAAGAIALLAAGWLLTQVPPAKKEGAPAAPRTERPAAVPHNPPPGGAGTPPAAAARPRPAAPQISGTGGPPGDISTAFLDRMHALQQQPPGTLGAPQTAPPMGAPPRPAGLPQGGFAGEPAPGYLPPPNLDSMPGAQVAGVVTEANGAATPGGSEPPPDRLPPAANAIVPATPVPAPAQTLPATPPRVQPVAPAQRPPRAAPLPPGQVPTEPAEPALTRLRDAAVTLQAVAWSSDPERRMAVINEQTVREGHTIQGYTIATIREESVVVRKGAEAWELRYGH